MWYALRCVTKEYTMWSLNNRTEQEVADMVSWLGSGEAVREIDLRKVLAFLPAKDNALFNAPKNLKELADFIHLPALFPHSESDFQKLATALSEILCNIKMKVVLREKVLAYVVKAGNILYCFTGYVGVALAVLKVLGGFKFYAGLNIFPLSMITIFGIVTALLVLLIATATIKLFAYMLRFTDRKTVAILRDMSTGMRSNILDMQKQLRSNTQLTLAFSQELYTNILLCMYVSDAFVWFKDVVYHDYSEQVLLR